ncbi:MAG: hypothetical protein SF182_29195 [Deltaproteobacteria bacterium]|nr:hypothetical protein [Deltaproteobacteria bacterium]
MRRLILLLAVLAMWSTMPAERAAAGGGGVCCLCIGCPTGPEDCTLPPLSCDVTCGSQRGCGDWSLAPLEACNANPPCEGQQPESARAPAATTLGLAGVTAALAGFGLRRLMRRRA